MRATTCCRRKKGRSGRRKANVKSFESQKSQLEARNLESKKEAGALAERLDGQQFVILRSASDGGALYGSVSTRDAADAATEAGFSVDRRPGLPVGADQGARAARGDRHPAPRGRGSYHAQRRTVGRGGRASGAGQRRSRNSPPRKTPSSRRNWRGFSRTSARPNSRNSRTMPAVLSRCPKAGTTATSPTPETSRRKPRLPAGIAKAAPPRARPFLCLPPSDGPPSVDLDEGDVEGQRLAREGVVGGRARHGSR